MGPPSVLKLHVQYGRVFHYAIGYVDLYIPMSIVWIMPPLSFCRGMLWDGIMSFVCPMVVASCLDMDHANPLTQRRCCVEDE